MIQHIVMFKMQVFDNQNEKIGVLNKIKSELESLSSKISQIKSIEAGINMIHSERAFDLVLVATFNSLEDLKIYADHPEHQKIVTLIRQYSEKAISVDYEK